MGTNDKNKTVVCGETMGRYVHIVLPDTGILTICEVQISKKIWTGVMATEGDLIKAASGKCLDARGSQERMLSSTSSRSLLAGPKTGQPAVVDATDLGEGVGDHRRRRLSQDVLISKGRPTTQSSTCCGGSSSRAVDGITNSIWGGSSCTHTSRNHQPWWRVDLGSYYELDRVKFYNRGDCCGDRLDKAEVYIGNSGSWGSNTIVPKGVTMKVGSTVSLSGGRAATTRRRVGYWCSDISNTIQCKTEYQRRRSKTDATGGVPPVVTHLEKFTVVDAGDGKIALRGGLSARFCSDLGDNVKCNTDMMGATEKFTVSELGNGQVSLRGGKYNRLCADEHNRIRCNRNGLGQWEKFTVTCITGCDDTSANTLQGGSKTLDVRSVMPNVRRRTGMARYVHIVLKGVTDYLNLCEVEVYKYIPAPTKAPTKAPTYKIDTPIMLPCLSEFGRRRALTEKHQEWNYNRDNGQIRTFTGKCLEATNLGVVYMKTCETDVDKIQKTQAWTYNPFNGQVRDVNNNRCLHVRSENSIKNGGIVDTVARCDPRVKGQIWQFGIYTFNRVPQSVKKAEYTGLENRRRRRRVAMEITYRRRRRTSSETSHRRRRRFVDSLVRRRRRYESPKLLGQASSKLIDKLNQK